MKRHTLTNVAFSRIALVDKGASFDKATGDGAHVLIFKRATPADGDNTMTPEDILKAVAALTPEQKASLQKALGAAPAPEDVLKGLTPAQRELVEKAQADATAAKADAAVNKAAIETLQKAARTESLRKRVDVFKHLSGDKAVLAEVVGLIEDSNKDIAKKFEEILAAHDAQLAKGGVTGGPVGSRGTGETPGDGSARAEVEKRVAAIIQKDAKLSKDSATSQVFSEDAALYQRYHEETAGIGDQADKQGE